MGRVRRYAKQASRVSALLQRGAPIGAIFTRGRLLMVARGTASSGKQQKACCFFAPVPQLDRSALLQRGAPNGAMFTRGRLVARGTASGNKQKACCFFAAVLLLCFPRRC